MQALGPAWLRSDPAAASFLNLPVAPEALAQAPVRAPSEAARRVLRDLNPGDDGGMDAAVVTGQQLGLFGGPCFTLYKAWTAVRWARALSDLWGLRVRAVFWLQTEDHDFAEVAWCGCPGGTRVALSDAALSERAPRASVSERRVPDEVPNLIRAFSDAVGPCFYGEDVRERLLSSWRPGALWTEAFAELLRWTFERDELLLFDPRHPDAAEAAAPLHERALFDADGLMASLQSRAAQIEAAGFGVQVPVRPETLSFVHLDGPGGERHRLRWTGGGAVAPDGRVVSEASLKGWLSSEPDRFTTSALLRPLVQDHLLPTVAYVAGPGEASYWAQLPPLYRAFDMAMPQVLPRARARLVEPWARRLLDQRGLSAGDVEVGVDQLLERMGIGRQGDPPEAIAGQLAAVRRELQASLRTRCEGIDVDGPLGALDRKLQRSFGRFVEKYETVRRRSDRDELAAAERLCASLAPDGAPQERFTGFMGYFARHGRDHVMGRLRDRWSPGDVETVDVEL